MMFKVIDTLRALTTSLTTFATSETSVVEELMETWSLVVTARNLIWKPFQTPILICNSSTNRSHENCIKSHSRLLVQAIHSSSKTKAAVSKDSKFNERWEISQRKVKDKSVIFIAFYRWNARNWLHVMNMLFITPNNWRLAWIFRNFF